MQHITLYDKNDIIIFLDSVKIGIFVMIYCVTMVRISN